MNDSIPIATIHDLAIELRLTCGGTVHPWMGSSIRGWLLAAIKGIRQGSHGNDDTLPMDPNGLCRLAKQFASASEAQCAACFLRTNCSFGASFEGALRSPARMGLDQKEPMRAACFLSPVLRGLASDADKVEFAIAIQLVGHAAVNEVSTLIERLRQIHVGCVGGYRSRLWSDAAHVRYEQLPLESLYRHEVQSRVNQVDIELESPLMLKSKHLPKFNSSHRFEELFMRSTSVLESLLTSSQHSHIDFRSLVACAKDVVCMNSDLIPFEQSRSSSRTSTRSRMQGYLGTMSFRNVPAHLLPWIRWGGILGVGNHRSSGAGRWNTFTRHLLVREESSYPPGVGPLR